VPYDDNNDFYFGSSYSSMKRRNKIQGMAKPILFKYQLAKKLELQVHYITEGVILFHFLLEANGMAFNLAGVRCCTLDFL
jgi:hypothetical protein